MLTNKLLIFICFIATFAYGETLSKIDQKDETTTSKNETQLLQDSLQDDNIQMKTNVAVQERAAVQRREMRGRGGGSRGSSYSGRSSYSGSSSRYSGYSSSSYRSSYSPTSKYRYSYSTYKNPTSYSNGYYSKTTMRTSRPLYVYYRAPNYYNAVGYYSTVFLIVYYNGYGYNFYYGQYGYYEYSVNQRPESSGSIIGQIIGCLCCCAVCGIVCWYCKKSKHVDGSESGSEHVIEEIVVEEHYGGGPPPGHYDPNMGAPPMYPPGGQPGYNPNMVPMQGQPMMGQPVYGQQPMQMQQPYPQQPMMQQPYGQQPGPGGMYAQPGQPMMQQPGQPMMQQPGQPQMMAQQPMYQQQ